ncbi:hypothetical protein Poli38472_013231 [Pythium oligandrum]|uniref:Phospholipid-transporting ATPase n=1 Tax=Pythium oligandrum TaxID=41045 RepID=A0A8K1C2Q2_PYTOL|nr:hypothetical protein Poli38472_013231 [Pythium oligandrum]|eukprot:TMW55340.1 hypothetical protein Poli38472_013231 [Pythium oligandrum]
MAFNGDTAVAPRLAHLNDASQNQELIRTRRYAENVIVTSKYTVVSFLPKTIFEFFRVVANVYFLLISILQLATPWSPTNRFTTAGPLVFVLLVTMVKQASEDVKRHQADEKQNNRQCRVINDQGQVEMIAWKALQVGQLLLLHSGEELPADIVLLATSEEEGRCFIETSNLDGETNLKRRVAVKATAERGSCYRELNGPALDESRACNGVLKLRGSIEYEQPNNQLYHFTGRLVLTEPNETAPIGPENVMLRGCGVRSCSFVVGVVIFTGSETKLLQNSRMAPSKQSKLYRTANRCMMLIFTTMFVLCIISASVAAKWNHTNHQRVWYLPFIKRNNVADFIVNFFTFLILYNNLVPISLYVSLDIIKVLQARAIMNDPDMTATMEDGQRVSAIARTSDLNEELGQVEYIFSDKTGTLTCNVMAFRKCSIGGISYGFGTTEIGRAVAALRSKGDGNATKSEPKGDAKAAQVHYTPSIAFDDPSLLAHLYDDKSPQSNRINEFLTLLSICHTVIPERDTKTCELVYRASSPDEEALVKAARCFGYNFYEPAPITKVEITRKADPNSKQVVANKSYTILNINEFNSTRKRMSVVCVNEKNEYVLYCKGADNMMLARASATTSDQEVYERESMQEHLRTFASEGLRTLVLGRRVLSEEEYNSYNQAYIDAANSLDNRDAKLDAVAEMIEKDMTIVGVTAIEDKLQEDVAQTIYDLAQAGIRIWVLTGDREETAINIGHACRLISESMKLIYVNNEEYDMLERQIEELHGATTIQQLIKDQTVADDLAMVCDGKALVHIFPSKDALMQLPQDVVTRRRVLAAKLLDVASVCKALIACRVSPSQKADIVHLVRKGCPSQPITLAIGDGANDVSMIQTAHVGVGICGKEGVQAVNASDYAIAEFRFLKRLLLVHGRFNYKRLCKVLQYSFYKNIALVISLFCFNFYNGQSGSPLFESFVMAGWNFFTATPIIVIGVFDQDVSEKIALQFAPLYRASQQDSDLNFRTFARTILNAMIHALICFWVCWLCFNPTFGLFMGGTVFYSALLMTMNLKVISLTLRWTMYHLAFLAFSAWLFFIFLVIYQYITFLTGDMLGVTRMLFRERTYWQLFFVTPMGAMLLDLTLVAVQTQWFPTAEDILREHGRRNSSLVMNSSSIGPGSSAGSEKQGLGMGLVPKDVQPHFTPASARVTPRLSVSRDGSLRITPSVEVVDADQASGFAFNGLAKESTSTSEAESVTKRVQSFNEQRRLESLRRQQAIQPQHKEVGDESMTHDVL